VHLNGRLSFGALLLVTWSLTAPLSVVAANDCSDPALSTECAPQPRFRAQVGPYDVNAVVVDLGPRGFKTAITATMTRPGVQTPGGSDGGRANPGPSGITVSPILCRRDDYAFLPPGALAGIPCDVSSSGNSTDPRQIARGMFDNMDMPSLRVDMNPRLGMVAVPTWFWVEGYDGDVIPLTDNLLLTHQECHRVADRDANGIAQLDANGIPRTHQDCRIISDTLTVEVRVWPRMFEWSFGDNHGKTVGCPDVAACPAGIGQPYTDPRSPSPIAHAYQWSSLGANGAADAYTIGLGITFGAQYRFSTNGGSLSGWQGLGDRGLSWSATHQVQEAQAIITGP
jgi:hypothetical protein